MYSSKNFFENKYKKAIFIFSVFMIIYLTDTILFATNLNQKYIIIKRILPVILVTIMCVFYYSKKQKIFEKDLQLILVSISILTSMLISGRLLDGYSYITQIACLIFGLHYSYYVNINDFAKYFVKIMGIIAILSLFFYFFKDLAYKNFIPNITNCLNNPFKFLFFTNVPILPSPARRNWGPFREPGVYQFYLNFALYFSLFYIKKNKIMYSILFSITTLTTLSGAALLPLVLILMAFVVEKKNLKALVLFLFLMLMILLLIKSGYCDEIIEKMLGKADTNSMAYRLGSLLAGIKITLLNPIFGATPEINDIIRQEIIVSLGGGYNAGLTNTFISYFSYYGIFVGFYLTYRLWNFCSLGKKSIASKGFVFLAILAVTSNQNLMSCLLVCVILFINDKNECIYTNKN